MSDVDPRALALAAREAARQVARLPGAARSAAIAAMADALDRDAGAILDANARDVSAAAGRGLSAALTDRLRLDPERLAAMAAALREIAAQPDPVGEVVRAWTRPNGLRVARVRIPLGVVLIVYESRPNVTSDAAGLCLRAGNAVILRGGSEAFSSNAAIAAALARGCRAAGVPPAAVQLVPTPAREAMVELLRADGLIDLCIPRGGEALIRFVAEHARVPVIRHYKGVCHVYVHAAADVEQALAVCYNAKVQRPGVCNAAETILVDRSIAPQFLPRLAERLLAAGVEIRADAEARALAAGLAPASEEDWAAEYLDLKVALRLVDGVDAALDHIARYGSDHTEAIVTADAEAARRFVEGCGSATVCVNASTRFADGGELGLGAEIGISTSKLHAYGPMGAQELTAVRFVVHGEGHVRT